MPSPVKQSKEKRAKACHEEMHVGAGMAGLQEEVSDVLKKFQRNTVARAAHACIETQRPMCIEQAQEELNHEK